jgi:hypothetical protein
MNTLFVDMQATFLAIALQPPPTASANILALFDLAGAGLATYAGVALEV